MSDPDLDALPVARVQPVALEVQRAPPGAAGGTARARRRSRSSPRHRAGAPARARGRCSRSPIRRPVGGCVTSSRACSSRAARAAALSPARRVRAVDGADELVEDVARRTSACRRSRCATPLHDRPRGAASRGARPRRRCRRRGPRARRRSTRRAGCRAGGGATSRPSSPRVPAAPAARRSRSRASSKNPMIERTTTAACPRSEEDVPGRRGSRTAEPTTKPRASVAVLAHARASCATSATRSCGSSTTRERQTEREHPATAQADDPPRGVEVVADDRRRGRSSSRARRQSRRRVRAAAAPPRARSTWSSRHLSEPRPHLVSRRGSISDSDDQRANTFGNGSTASSTPPRDHRDPDRI